ncbi:MAG TPA: acyl-ACP thioesterase domain-containing protein [Bacteroidales bacterium]|nr:acyl-ACP thioesterase domain-containing protein [Bacteroidales bacterium]
MESQKLSKKYRVHVYETGPNGKLNVHSLFNYFQDIASDHAELLGFGRDDLQKNNHFWVLSRMYVEISKLPFWEDTVEIQTWPSGIEGLFALRNYEISGNEGIIVKASSSWLILDRSTKKIQRPETAFSGHEFPPEKNFTRKATKLNPVEQGEPNHCLRIKASDLDINLHTNNAAYIRLIFDTYDLGFIMENDPQTVEINYLAESKFGDEIDIITYIHDCEHSHSIIRKVDRKEICRLKTNWKKAE